MDEISKEKSDNTICIHPFASLSIHATGHMTRCHMSEQSMGRLSSGINPIKLWNNDKFVGLRKKMLRSEWDVGCNNCLRKELLQVKSKRTHWQGLKVTKDLWSKKIFNADEKKDIYFIDIAFNNFCNFKCRMCSSAYSSKWAEDELKLREVGVYGGSGCLFAKTAVLLENPMHSLSRESINKIVDSCSKVRRIDVVGGEPFLTKDFSYFLSKCREQNIGSDVSCTVTTNGSVYDEEYLDKLDIFKHVTLNISVDGTGEYFNYIRAGNTISWDSFNTNIDNFILYVNNKNKKRAKSWKVNLNGAFQTYNILNIESFIDWIVAKYNWQNAEPEVSSKYRNSFEHRLLMGPMQLSAKSAPRELKEISLSQIEKLKSKYHFLDRIEENSYISDIKRVLEAKSDKYLNQYNDRWLQFCWYTIKLDKVRNQSYNVLGLALSELINKTLESQSFKLAQLSWENKKYYKQLCDKPWKALTVNNDRSISPCKSFAEKARFKIGDSDDIYNSSQIKTMRKQIMSRVRPDGCSTCWNNEQKAGASERTSFLDDYREDYEKDLIYEEKVEDYSLSEMTIRISNECNLKCRMCHSGRSSSWYSDDQKLYEIDNNIFNRKSNGVMSQIKALDKNDILQLLPAIEKAKKLNLTGGEPLLSRQNIQLLELLVKNGLNKKIILSYETNGAIYSSELLQLLAEFKSVELNVSMNSYGSLYNYITGNSSLLFTDVINNLRYYDELSNIVIKPKILIMSYNLHQICDLVKYIYSLKLTKLNFYMPFKVLTNPDYLSPFVWPISYRSEQARKLKNIKSLNSFCQHLLSKEFKPELYSHFINYTKSLDAIRGESFENFIAKTIRF